MANPLKNLLARLRGEGPIVPVLRIAGVIAPPGRFGTGIYLDRLAGPLNQAFSMGGTPAVALIINSPGGSPVQSHLIYKRIRALAAETSRPVIVFTEDVAASGGYMIACAGDEIVSDPSSIIDSIRVVRNSFPFTLLISHLA